MKRHVALVGFMAAGKSSIGARVARALGREFVDTDAAIVAKHGPIPEIFESRGEPAFRLLELAAAAHAFTGPPRVVSLGGGALTYEPTRVLTAAEALRVYLEASPSTILRRVRRSPTVRPMLGPTATLERIERLLEARVAYYLASEIVVRVDAKAMSAIAREIIDRIQALEGGRT